jgi:peptidoglycan/xylan/chitin deacetylase (PgdA/CDA1 family)
MMLGFFKYCVVTLILFTCAVFSAQGQTVYVYQSLNTQKFFASANGNHDVLANYWYTALERIGQRFEKTDANRLSALRQPGVLILPSTVLLDENERQMLRKLAANGWGLFGTWALGARDGKGAWVGYGFIDEIFQAKIVGDVDTSKTNGWFLFPVGESPVSFDMSPGERMFLPKGTEPLLTLQASSLGAIGGDWVRQSNLGAQRSGLISFSELGNSRRLFWSIPETSWEAARPRIDQLIRNGLSWLKREVTVQKSAWPHPYQSALLIEMDTEEQFANALNLAELFEARQARGTFYLLTSLAKNNPDIVKRLATKHELAYHADVHDGFRDLPYAAQETRMKNMQSQLSSVIGDTSAALGFRAPLESYDANTEIALRRLGFKHHTASMNSGDIMLPSFSKAEPELGADKAIVNFPRDQLDDINFVRMGATDPVRMQQLLLEGTERSIQLRGFSLLSVHSQYMAKGSPLLQSLPKLFDRIAEPTSGVWLAPASQIEQWWRAREMVTVTSKIQGRKVQINLQHPNIKLKNFRIVVQAPDAKSVLRIVGKQGLAQAQALRLDDQRWAVVLPELGDARSSLQLQFD